MNKKFMEEILLSDKYKNGIRVKDKKSGKVLFERDNLVTQRGRIFVLEKIFDDKILASDVAGQGIIINYYYEFKNLGEVGPYYYKVIEDESDPQTQYVYVELQEDAFAYTPPWGGAPVTIPALDVVYDWDGSLAGYIFYYISNEQFDKRKIAFFKVGKGGTTTNLLEPVVPSPRDISLKETTYFRIIDESIDDNDYSNIYCIKQQVEGTSLYKYFGKYFDNLDPIWQIDEAKNKISKVLSMSINEYDLRDIIVVDGGGEQTVEQRYTTDKEGVISKKEDQALLVGNTSLDLSSLSEGDLIKILKDTTYYIYEFVSTSKIKDNEGHLVDSAIIKLTDGGAPNFDEVDNDTFYGIYDITDNLISVGGAGRTIFQLRITDVEKTDQVYYEDELLNYKAFAISSETAEITPESFKIALSSFSIFNIEEVENVVLTKKISETELQVIGLVDISLNYLYNAYFNELGLFFAEIDGAGKVVDGTEELFSRITFATCVLEKNQEVEIEYFIYV